MNVRSLWIDRLSERVGHGIAWLTLVMVLVTFAVVVLRYVFASGRIWLQESITWMHALIFMLGAAYALRTQDHVRVDVFYRRFSACTQAWVNLLGTVLFLLPFCGYLLYESYDYVLSSWSIRESSREAGGLPGLFVLKTIIPITAVLLALQGIAEIIRALRQLRHPRGEAGSSAVHSAEI